MEKISINDLKEEQGLDFVCDDIFYAASLHQLPASMFERGLNFEATILCNRGTFEITIDNHTFKVSKDQLFIMGDESVIHEFLATKDLDFSITGFSWNLIEDTRHLYTTRWPMVDYVVSNPLVTLDGESLEMFKMYEQQKQRIARSAVSLFKEELIHNAVQSEIYEFIRGINGVARPHTTADEGRGNLILRDFLDILYSEFSIIL